ncbi:sialyltransferase [Chloropicon primus]|uniref:Sialyltransferase n=1 Tax=Chloropicon primus TaxID=1764295 RepID=A0A5B8MJG6_9CHLO|nr:sialyltransferase [Chloropicon primus]UPQ99837.1 sialyltransferase [Chloropicon primus]|eukprot:QDZ20626.1 sialyltransferase [Chloropicon primus]
MNLNGDRRPLSVKLFVLCVILVAFTVLLAPFRPSSPKPKVLAGLDATVKERVEEVQIEGVGASSLQGGDALKLAETVELQDEDLAEDEEEQQEEQQEIKAINKWEDCSDVKADARPTLEGIPLFFTDENDNLNYDDVFIHKKNYKRFWARGSYVVDNDTIATLPSSHEEIIGYHKFNSCAVVGNSGYLRFTEFGDAIDTHDVVLRLNQAPTKKFSKWVGTKTSIRLINNLWSIRYGSERDFGKIPLEKNLTLVVSRTRGFVFDNIVKFLGEKRPDVKVVRLNSRMVSASRRLLVAYRVKMCKDGYKYEGGISPTSGFVGTYILRMLCKRVTLYGLGMVKSRAVPYHYMTGTIGARTAPTSVHSFPAESATLDALAFENKIEQCKYREKAYIARPGESVSNLRSNFTVLNYAAHNNHYCGWNVCHHRRYWRFWRRVIKESLPFGGKDVPYKDCWRVMFSDIDVPPGKAEKAQEEEKQAQEEEEQALEEEETQQALEALKEEEEEEEEV